MTPTQRTMDELRKRGYMVGRVEQWIPAAHGGFRKDLFGIIDLLAISGELTLGIQVCGTAWSAHVDKLKTEGEKSVRAWLQSPHRHLELWGWRPLKYGERRIHRLRRGMIYVRYDGAPIEVEEFTEP
jgi:hypothetical protein